MITFLVLAYIGVWLFMIPKVARSFARNLLGTNYGYPLDDIDRFFCLFFGLLVSAVWPLWILYGFACQAIFDKETK